MNAHTKTPAKFTYRGANTLRNKTVRLYEDPFNNYIVDVVDVYGRQIPYSARRFRTVLTAVRAFALYREYAAKDHGATEVNWGSFSELSRFWPKEATPWNEPIR